MKNWLYLAAAAATILGPLQVRAAGTPAEDCEKLTALKLKSAQITSAHLAGPDFSTPSSSISPSVRVKSTFCRVTGLIDPSTKFEIWLSSKAGWNGKFQGLGNGGMAGGINYIGLQSAVERGYAAVSSDLGHEGGALDGSFAIGAPEKVRDWGYRATHEMTAQAKAVVAAFYGSTPRYSYFLGCSGGGRQGLIEAQRFPDDYDGILAGDPTIDFTHLTTGGRLWAELSMLKTPHGVGYIPPQKVPAIAAAVVAACDALDGVRDGILEDPRQCHFDPAALRCSVEERSDCLTDAQITALKQIYAGAKTTDGHQIYPGYEPGGELGPSGWAGAITGPAPMKATQWQYARGFLTGMVFEDPHYDPMTFNFDEDVVAMDQKPVLGEPLSQVINGTDPDLSAFKKRGGKLIVYHGWSDPGVAPRSTIGYYETVAKRTGLKDMQTFFRLFMVPGMQHCFGGPGANVVGAPFQRQVPPDPEHDITKALERWVERGTAPRMIIATKYVDDKPDQGIERTHPLCPYPQAAHFTGSGDGKNAADFLCK
jgi:feruloyl esterase